MLDNNFFFYNMYTYIVKSGYFDSYMIDKLFEKRGNWKKYTSGKVTFLYIDGDFIYNDKTHYNIKANIKNLFDASSYSIGNKSQLYIDFEKYNPALCYKYMMKQYHISKNNTLLSDIFETNKHYILKPIAGHKGIGIHIYDSYDKMKEYVTLYPHNNKTAKLGWVLSEYITNPMLHNNRKFHFRSLRRNFIFMVDWIGACIHYNFIARGLLRNSY